MLNITEAVYANASIFKTVLLGLFYKIMDQLTNFIRESFGKYNVWDKGSLRA